jgi:uncharacterized protein
VDIKLGVSMILGTTVGMEIGARLVMRLERLGLAESVIRKAYVVFLFFIGSFVLYDYISNIRRKKRISVSGEIPARKERFAQKLQRLRIPPVIHFEASGVTCSLNALIAKTPGMRRREERRQ